MQTKNHPLLEAILLVNEYADDDMHLVIFEDYENNKRVHFAYDKFFSTGVSSDDAKEWEEKKVLEISEVNDLLYLNDKYELNSICESCENRWNKDVCFDCEEYPWGGDRGHFKKKGNKA